MSDELSSGELGEETRRVRVRVEMVLEITEPDELIRAAWARIERQWPGYRQYERDSGRTVRLFRLTTDATPSPFDGRL